MLDWARIIAVSEDGTVNAFDGEILGMVVGKAGAPGDPARIIGVEAETLPAGSPASVVNTGTPENAYFVFGIPKGEDGGGGGGGGGDDVSWGSIIGDLSNQTDLQNALDAKADAADLGDLATQDTVDYITEVTNKPTLGDLSALDSIDYTSNKLTNKPTLGALAPLDSIDYTSNKLTNKPTLGSLADQDTVDYATEVTNKPLLGSMALMNDAPLDSKVYGRKNGSWTEVTGGGGGGSAAWGSITGTLSNQTDLQTALDGKVSDTGDTMTGALIVKSTNIAEAAPQSTVTGSGVKFISNSSSVSIGGFYPDQGTDNSITIIAQVGYVSTHSGSVAQGVNFLKITPRVGVSSDFAFADQICSYFSESTSYAVGDYVIYTKTLYRFTSAHSAGAWNASDVTAVKVTSELSGKANTSDLGDLAALDSIDYTGNYITNKPTLGTMAALDSDDIIAPDFDATAAYSSGDYVIYNGSLYRFTSSHSAGAWSGTDATAVTIDGELINKAPLASPALTGTPTAPTASVGTNSTQIATTAFVHSRGCYYVSGSVSAGSSTTLSNASITSTMHVISINFGTPGNVKSDVTCTTASGSITIAGTFIGSSTVQMILAEADELTVS